MNNQIQDSATLPAQKQPKLRTEEGLEGPSLFERSEHEQDTLAIPANEP
jgi:hypothetical protein